MAHEVGVGHAVVVAVSRLALTVWTANVLSYALLACFWLMTLVVGRA